MKSTSEKIAYLLSVLVLLSCLEAPDNKGNRKKQATGDAGPLPPQAITDSNEAFQKSLYLQQFRNKGSKQISHFEATKKLIESGSLPANYMTQETSSFFDENAKTSFYTPRSSALNCGQLSTDESPTIIKRIKDCEKVFTSDPFAYKWSGEMNGVLGEGEWHLVIKKENKHIWLDKRAGILWTHSITQASWNNAVGVAVDPKDSICSNEYLKLLNDSANDDVFLGLKANEVELKLPSKNDFFIADTNGSRFVLFQDDSFWTANYDSLTNQAWSIQGKSSILERKDPQAQVSVRCIGFIKK